MFNYRFYISCDVEGVQEPFMRFGPNENHTHLEHLARGHLSKSAGVRQELDSIQAVFDGKRDVHSFGGDDWCIVDFKNEISVITNFFDEFEPFEIESKSILKLMQNWYEFLLMWENGQIPGIIHPDKREPV